MTPKEFQQTLIAAGYPLPKYGPDGYWGGETSNACVAWFDSQRDITIYEEGEPLPPPVTGQVVPDSWMPTCDMDRIVVHWTAGAYEASENDREHYHILIDGNSALVRGKYAITANVSISDADGYAAHTKDKNTKSIGLAVCCMSGAVESPFSSGKYPMLHAQWVMLAQATADCCRRYGIPNTKTTVLGHGCVQANLGVTQSGKWDPDKLPWDPGRSIQAADQLFRDEVAKYL